jgi:3-hydroxyacyl-[acyl-carrier-protein] dehydratase
VSVAGESIDPFALLPHRYPFLLLDRIVLVEPKRTAIGTKMVTGSEWTVIGSTGHGGAHAMPHLLIVEALAQLSAAVLVSLLEADRKAIGYFMGIDNVRFRRQAAPGEMLSLSVELKQFRRGVCRTRGIATIDDELVVRADLTTILRAT